LLLVMLAPAYEPLAMACAAQPGAMRCCRRKALSAGSAQPAMPCHHAMAEAKAAKSESSKVESSETSVQASNDGNCCQKHRCCGPITSEWAKPASNLFSVLSLLIEPARPAPHAEPQSSNISECDSARAPPRI